MASPFASKFKTNYCPTVDETVEIKNLIADKHVQLQRLESKIAELQQGLSKLLDERESLESNMHSHEALLSPIRRMPTDVMQEIFMACLPTHRNCVMDASEAPLLLGRVCIAWRTLSVGTPRLWARLHVVDPGQQWSGDSNDPQNLVANQWNAAWGVPPVIGTAVDRPKASLVANAVQDWFGRSGQCPLSISLHLDCRHRRNCAPSNSKSIVEVILSLVTRWQHIHFTIGDAVLEDLARLTAADVPELKSVTLQQYGDAWGGESARNFTWDRLFMLFGAQVTNVTVAGRNVVLSQLPLHWTNLTALSNLSVQDDSTVWRSRPASIDRVMLTVSKCSQLRRLSLLLGKQPTTCTAENIPVDLALLDSLHLSGDVGTCVALLDRIAVPKLRELKWNLRNTSSDGWGAEPQPLPTEALVRFLTALPLLESLSLTARQLSSSSIKDILLHLPPNLQSLHVAASFNHVPSFDEDVLLFLMTPQTVGSSTPLPLLRDLRIDGGPSISDTNLLRFITSRASTLKRVNIHFAREKHVDIRPDLSPLIDKGLDFSVTYFPALLETDSPWAGLPDAPQISPAAAWGLPTIG